MVLETSRLSLRCLTDGDYADLCRVMLQDPEVMYAYAHAFSDEEAWEWLHRQQTRYREDGFGLWAVELRETGELIGQCGVTWQTVRDRRVPEIGYLLGKSSWGRGYAIEAARACKKYAFHILGFDEVYSIIRDNNLASQRVAIRNGMLPRDRIVKHYYRQEMPHVVFSVRRDEGEERCS